MFCARVNVVYRIIDSMNASILTSGLNNMSDVSAKDVYILVCCLVYVYVMTGSIVLWTEHYKHTSRL